MSMNKEVIIVVLDAHSTMGKQFASSKDLSQTRFAVAIDAIKLQLQQKVTFYF